MRAGRVLSAVVYLFAALASPAFAQPAAATADLELPGGVAPLARALGLDPTTAVASRLIVEWARLAYGVPEGQNDNLRAAALLRQYFATVDSLNAANWRLSLRDLGGRDDRRSAPLLSALGITIAGDPPRAALAEGTAAELQRAMVERAGIEIETIVDTLNRGEEVALKSETGRVPLPLGTEAWTGLLPRKLSDRPIYRTLFEDRHACLLYAGLAALDPETLAALAAIRNVGRDLYERAPVFASLARALHIRNGAVLPPGGGEAAPMWEAVVGAPLADPAAFIRRLYGGEGRLAYVYDTISTLDPPHQQYALGLWIASPSDRLDRFRKLVSLFATYDESWRLRQTPFSRPPLDPPLILPAARVAPDGRPRAPASREFWSAVLAEPSFDPARRYEVDTTDAADAPWLLGRVLEPPVAARRGRNERVQFAMRLLDRGVTDPITVIRAAHGLARFPSLILTLERMSITDATLYADAAHRAASFDQLDGTNGITALTLFQASLAIVDRARFSRTVSPEQATALVRSLVALNVSSPGYEGAIAQWFDRVFLPSFSSEGGNPDILLVQALAGVSPAKPVTVTWENFTYRVDLAAAEVGRLQRLRREQRVASIAAVLAFARAVAATPANDQPVPEAVQAALASVTADRDAPTFAGLREAIGDAQSLLRERRLRGHDRERLLRLSDRLLAYSLLTLVYALSLGDADADPTTVFDPQLGDRHDFGKAGAWTIPHEESGGGQPWHMQGSLLCLDIGLARFALRRLSTEPPMQAPRVSSNDRQAFAESVALLNPYEFRDEDASAIAAAVARGRERIARLLSHTPTEDDDDRELDNMDGEARLGAWQREAIRWSLRNDTENAAALFSIGDAFWLGAPPPSLMERLDGWGLSARPLDGSVISRFPRALEWESFAGRPSVGLLATQTPEIMIRVAIALTELKLPAALARGIAAAAVLDVVDEAPLGHRDDRRAVAHYAANLPLARIQDYVSLLTAGGPLIPTTNRRGGLPRP